MSVEDLRACHVQTLAEFQQIAKYTINAARRAESTRSDCPEELEALQMLCQYIYTHLHSPEDCKCAIEWVFERLNMEFLLCRQTEN